jgi:hypothetical protein
MSLLTYEQARPWAKSIREKVALGQMPPWHAVQPRGTFSNDRRLSELEKNTLITGRTPARRKEIRRTCRLCQSLAKAGRSALQM